MTDAHVPAAVYWGLAVALAAALLAAALIPLAPTPPSVRCSDPVPVDRPTASPIRHVFFLIKENHALENYFGDLPGVQGYPPNGSFPIANGSNATVHPFAINASSTPDLPHDRATDVTDLDAGHNDRFVEEAKAAGSPDPAAAVGYYTAAQIPDYYAYARNYTLDDEFFTGVLGPTLPNRLFDLGLTNTTWSSDGVPNASSVAGPTLPGQLEAAGIPWDYFFSGIEAGLTPLVVPQFASDRCMVQRVVPMTEFSSLLAGPNAPSVAYIDPSQDLTFSEHPPSNVTLGDEWTVAAVNALFESPIGPSSVVFIFFDENGGYWDPVVPPAHAPLGDGFRVPLLIVSPWTPAGVISHEVIDPSSLLRFVDDNFHLPYLTPRVASAPSIDGLFDFNATPRSPSIRPTPIDLRIANESFPLLGVRAPDVRSSMAPNAGYLAALVLRADDPALAPFATRWRPEPGLHQPCSAVAPKGTFRAPLIARPSVEARESDEPVPAPGRQHAPRATRRHDPGRGGPPPDPSADRGPLRAPARRGPPHAAGDVGLVARSPQFRGVGRGPRPRRLGPRCRRT
ncbi:MAG TPA: alkaline phosphatase family protein [Thermoplasmata archaeon]|nr:alkaline phosphatase family protein [Thermoplasmata archaeon]